MTRRLYARSMQTTPRRREHAFALRLWAESGNGAEAWRGRIDDLQTGERRYFASLCELMEYIHRRIEACARDSPQLERRFASPFRPKRC